MNRRDPIEARLHRLELVNRCLLGLLLAAGAALAVLFVRAGEPPSADILRVGRLEIVDSGGQTRIAMSASREDAAIVLRDPAGAQRLLIHHDDEESGLYVSDAAGDTRAGIAHYAHGGSGVALHGPGVRGAAVLYYGKTGSLTFYDEDGAVLERAPD